MGGIYVIRNEQDSKNKSNDENAVRMAIIMVTALIPRPTLTPKP